MTKPEFFYPHIHTYSDSGLSSLFFIQLLNIIIANDDNEYNIENVVNSN